MVHVRRQRSPTARCRPPTAPPTSQASCSALRPNFPRPIACSSRAKHSPFVWISIRTPLPQVPCFVHLQVLVSVHYAWLLVLYFQHLRKPLPQPTCFQHIQKHPRVHPLHFILHVFNDLQTASTTMRYRLPAASSNNIQRLPPAYRDAILLTRSSKQ